MQTSETDIGDKFKNEIIEFLQIAAFVNLVKKIKKK